MSGRFHMVRGRFDWDLPICCVFLSRNNGMETPGAGVEDGPGESPRPANENEQLAPPPPDGVNTAAGVDTAHTLLPGIADAHFRAQGSLTELRLRRLRLMGPPPPRAPLDRDTTPMVLSVRGGARLQLDTAGARTQQPTGAELLVACTVA
eukprot:COSAG01_NODE_1518_length_10043_cov_99.027951_10_plen_150_part_00